jgi:hypothetical protein
LEKAVKPPLTLNAWLDIALHGVASPDRVAVIEEITAHYQDALDWHRKTKPEVEAQQLAVRDLGDPVMAGRGYFLGYFAADAVDRVVAWIGPPTWWHWLLGPLSWALFLALFIAPDIENLIKSSPNLILGGLIYGLLTLFWPLLRLVLARSSYYWVCAHIGNWMETLLFAPMLVVAPLLQGQVIAAAIALAFLLFSQLSHWFLNPQYREILRVLYRWPNPPQDQLRQPIH